MRYIPINDHLCVVEQEIKTKNVVQKKENVNFIWIYDRSGSMTSLLPDLTNQMIAMLKLLPKNSTLSLGWFSGQGPTNYNFIFKGFKITDTSDYKAIEETIRKNSSSMNTTCFSEILSNVDTVIEDLTPFSKIFSMHFFTDGYPVVSDYKTEIDGIFSAIKKIKGRIQSAVFVAYGNFFNKELLYEMSSELGAMLIQSNKIQEYTQSLTKLINLSETQDPKEQIDPLIENPLAIFTLSDQGVVIYSLDDDGKLYISPTKGKTTTLYYISTQKPNKKSWSKVEIKDINFADETTSLSKALYASALILTQQVKTDIALEVIGKVGDKSLVNSLNNAFTIEEYGRAEDEINKSITDITLRFATGRDPNYLPPIDAFCVYDLLQLLMGDNDAAFFPYHEKFEYERIGVASKTREGFSRFEADKKSKCPFANLTWHESHLNLSVLTKINGTIILNEVGKITPESLSLTNPFPTFVFRNFSFIKDGRVHTKKFYITTSKQTYLVLKNKGIVIDDDFAGSGIYGLDVSTLPAINRKIACGKTSAKELCAWILQEQKLKASIKSLKWLRENEITELKKADTSYTDEQVAFLTQNGIDLLKNGTYSPPVDKEESKDQYMAKYFEIKIAGLASLPPVKKVIEKIASGKNRTPVETLVETGINQYNVVKASLVDDSQRQNWFDKVIENSQKELKAIRSLVQENKMAVILGKKWFFDSREENSLIMDGIEYKFELGEEPVDI